MQEILLPILVDYSYRDVDGLMRNLGIERWDLESSIRTYYQLHKRNALSQLA